MSELSIIDLEGNKIKVTNLPEALEQCRMYSEMEPEKGTYLERQKYWKDALQKVQKLADENPHLMKKLINTDSNERKT